MACENLAAMSSIAEAGGMPAAPKITHNIINNSSQPITAEDPTVAWHSNAREFMVNLILQDHIEGGEISQIFGQPSQ